MKIVMSIVIIGILLTIPLAYAQEYTQDDANKAGLLPDSKLYPLKIAFQKITEIFGGDNLKIKHANQRLSEIKVMVHLGLENETDKSIEDFNRIYREIKDKSVLAENKGVVDNLGRKISAIASSQSRGNMTVAEIKQVNAEIKQLINEHKQVDILEAKPIFNISEKISDLTRRRR